MKWYENRSWNDEIHTQFYRDYRNADDSEKPIALVRQAELLSESLDQHILKAAESLLLLWVSQHFKKADAQPVYKLIIKVSKRMGDVDRATQFERYLNDLRNL